MIQQLMAECRNFFEVGYREGSYTITDGVLSPADGLNGRFVRIKGSTFHDGVYRCEDGVLLDASGADETFTGVVWVLNPPPAFLQLAEKVGKFIESAPISRVVSESFGAYSHTMATGTNGVLTWQEAFARELLPYRRMYTEVG